MASISESLIPPAKLLVMIMERIYKNGMTTTSGGNLSIIDAEGDIYITPASVDKGALTEKDIVCVKKNGTVLGIHKPSSEYPFHKAIYVKRPDIKAVLHAHSPALVAYSIVRKIPDLNIIPQAKHICRSVGYAPYAIPGSEKLGNNIANTFEKGFDIVLLENHGIVSGGDTLFTAFQRFETLDFLARISISASNLGSPIALTSEQFNLFEKKRENLEEFIPTEHTTEERVLRTQMCEMIRRAYDQQIVTSTEGTLSVRLSETDFLITPYGIDRKYISEEDIVLISNSKKESGKKPSRSVVLHELLYADHRELGSIFIAHPPAAMAFAVTKELFDSKTIPESYIVLQKMPKIPYGTQIIDHKAISRTIGEGNPVLIIENDCILTTGKNILQAFDRLEVCDYSARAILNAMRIGTMIPIDFEAIKEIDKVFLGK